MHLSAITLIVPDYDAGIAFYCGVMGFELTEDVDQGRKRWVRVTPPGGETGFVLARADGEAQRAAIAKEVVRVHCGVTGAPPSFVHAFFSEAPDAYVRRRHAELQRERLRNPEIFERIAEELATRRFAAPTFSTRQIRRIVYG